METSYRDLGGRRDFFAETMRGHICSLELRFDEAWKHLDRALALSEDTEETVRGLVWRFLLEVFRIDTAIAECPVHPNVEIPPAPEVHLPPSILAAWPQVACVLRLQQACRARIFQQLGECDRAARIYTGLVSEHPETPPDVLASYHCNLAICQREMGLMEKAERNLENAGLATAACCWTINAAQAAAALLAFYSSLGDTEKSAEWWAFLLRLRCPPETKKLFVSRAQRLLDLRRQRPR